MVIVPVLTFCASAAVFFGILAELRFLAFAFETGIVIGETYYRDTNVLAGGIVFELLAAFILVALRDLPCGG